MATAVYKTGSIRLINNDIVELRPLKIKYLREFMDAFEFVKTAEDDDLAIIFLAECVRVCMKQFYPQIASVADVEDSFDIKSMYTVLDICGNINMNADREDILVNANEDVDGGGWEDLDLAKLESEAFMLGIWKDFDDLESSISLPELTAILEVQREKDYSSKKFAAALKGIDLDEQTGMNQNKEPNAWEKMKAKVFGNGTEDPNNITAYQGINAVKAGFGIGDGLGYEDLRQK